MEKNIKEQKPKKISEGNKIYWMVALLGAVGFVVVILGMSAWLYGGTITPVKESLFNRFPLPVASVSGRIIVSTDVSTRKQIALANSKVITYKQALGDEILDSQIKEVLLKNKVSFSKDFEKSVLDSIDVDDSKKKLPGFVVDSYLRKVELGLFYAGNEQLHSEDYKKARKMTELIRLGKKFGEAAEESGVWDKGEALRNLYGDQGYLNVNNILPELRSKLTKDSVGNAQIVATRNGLSVVQVYGWKEGNETNAPEAGVNVVILPSTGFENWLGQELLKVKTRVYLK